MAPPTGLRLDCGAVERPLARPPPGDVCLAYAQQTTAQQRRFHGRGSSLTSAVARRMAHAGL